MDVLAGLVEAGRRIRDAIAPLGDDVEVFVYRQDAFLVEVHEDELRPEMRVGRVQVGMRLLCDGAMTLASTSSLDPAENLEAIRIALCVGRPAPLPDFAAASTPLQEAIDPSLLPYVQDPSLVLDLARALRRRFTEAPRARLVSSFEASSALQLEWRAIVTSRGEGGNGRGALVARAELDASHGDRIYRPVGDPAAIESLERLGVRVLDEYPERALAPADLGVAGTRVQALLAPRLGEAIVRTVLQEKVIASSLANSNTRLRPGMAILGERFTLDSVADDPALMGCGPCDDEGTPTRRTRVIDGGVFERFVSSRKSAHRTGVAETGNGMRAPLFDEDMSEALIRDRLGGIEVGAGARSRAELVAGMERGVVLYSLLGLHGADKASGRFFATAHGGFAVRDGKVVGRLAPGHWSIAGGIFDGPSGRSILAEVEPSKEKEITGTARMPWLLGHVDVA